MPHDVKYSRNKFPPALKAIGLTWFFIVFQKHEIMVSSPIKELFRRPTQSKIHEFILGCS